MAHLQNRTSPRYNQVLQKSHQANAQGQTKMDRQQHDRKEGQHLTAA